eukprot:TRINITY_DN73_c1_g3_i2.p1 TRINITY_DN73_c1_g3~~TRINITY_DN73_c1_g3_i2.p1  ORF type:complete len:290 (-),score=140.98 TRINITY_DN73_c1_g3_i2:21-890(-)
MSSASFSESEDHIPAVRIYKIVDKKVVRRKNTYCVQLATGTMWVPEMDMYNSGELVRSFEKKRKRKSVESEKKAKEKENEKEKEKEKEVTEVAKEEKEKPVEAKDKPEEVKEKPVEGVEKEKEKGAENGGSQNGAKDKEKDKEMEMEKEKERKREKRASRKSSQSKKRKKSSSSSSSSEKKKSKKKPKVFEVESILEEKDGKYLVKWKGFSASEATWEPEENFIGAKDLLKKWKKRNSEKKKTPSQSEKKHSTTAEEKVDSPFKPRQTPTKTDQEKNDSEDLASSSSKK